MKKIIIVLLLTLLAPGLLLAADNGLPPSTGLSPPPGDLSISYLSVIFGVVDGVLHGTGSQILGNMLGIFNSAILVLVSIVLTYVLFISILNTANQGEFLGQKWSSMWVPVRMICGVGLLLPKATGYSFIQILVIWVITQGVGAADAVWSAALDYMNRSGTIVEPNQSLAPGPTAGKQGKGVDNSFLVSKAASVLKSESCMYVLHNGLVNKNRSQQGGAGGVPVPDFASSLVVTGMGPDGKDTGKPIDYQTDKGGFIQFPGKLGGTFGRYEGACGSVSWTFIGGKPDNKEVANPAKLTANDSASIGVRQITLDLSNLAQSIAGALAPLGTDTPPVVKLDPRGPLFIPDSLVYASGDYFAIVKPALRQLQEGANKQLKDFIQQAKDVGWVLAGSYYYPMARLNQSLRQITDLSLVKEQITPEFKPDYSSFPFTELDSTTLSNLKYNIPVTQGVIDGYMQDETARAKNEGGEHNQLFPNTGGGGIPAQSGIFAQIMSKIFESLQDFYQKLQDGLDSGGDPILVLSGIGDNLVHLVDVVWVSFFTIMTVIVVAGGAAGAAVSFIAPAAPIVAVLGAIIGFVGLFMPIFTFWIMLNLTLGATLAYYVPLIPFILFLFGVVTWFSVVLEAVMAAPLVALGITHPEGHDFLGKAEQSVMLLASVFLRPMLMVFGFIFGIILSYVAISLLNQGLSVAIHFMDNLQGDFLVLVSQTTLMLIYTGLVLALVNRSFSMIYEIPNRVMRWVGSPAESTPEEGMLQQIRTSVEHGTREVGTAHSQLAQTQVQSATQAAKAIGAQSSANTTARDQGSTVQSSSEGGGGGGTAGGGGGGGGGPAGGAGGGAGGGAAGGGIPPMVP